MNHERRRLRVAADEPGSLDRHPDDGWRLAEPRPMGRATEKVARAIIRALLPPPPAPTSADMEDRVLLHLRVMLQYMPPITGTGFVLLLHLLDWSPLWRFRGFLPLTAISTERASSVLQGIAESRLLLVRMMMLGPKGLILSTYFDQDEVGDRLGWEPKGFMRGRIDLRRRLLAGESAHADDMVHHVDGLPTVVARGDAVKPTPSVAPPAASAELS